MWVDTKGEDGPQCIHHTPVGALMAQPPPSRACRSLQYALYNTLNTTFIRITCGTHELRPYNVPASIPHSLRIEGECASSRPTVQCANRTIAIFKGVVNVVISGIVLKDHGEPNILMPTLCISNCNFLRLQHVTVYVTGQHGTGILLKYTGASGKITLYNVSVSHNGTDGVGIDCDIRGNSLTNSFSVYMNNVQVANTNTHTEYDPSMAFIGIAISARGIGSGTNITLHNVTVFNSAPGSGRGIYVALSDDMHNTTLKLAGVHVLDGWDERYQVKNKTVVLAECARRQLEMIQKSHSYASIFVLVQTSHNTINVTGVHVRATYGKTVLAIGVRFESLSSFNTMSLGKQLSFSLKGYQEDIQRDVLYVQLADNTYHNIVEIQDLHVVNSAPVSGMGVIVEFKGQCTGNLVLLNRSTIANLHALGEGGSLVAMFKDHAQNNEFLMSQTIVENNSARRGGGIQVILSDFASGNGILTSGVIISGNKANAGGGMYIMFMDFAVRNTVTLRRVYVVNNTLIPTPNDIMMGGGIGVYFMTDNATSETNNKVEMNGTILFANKANGGVGGGLSVFYEHSLYPGDSGDTHHMHHSIFLNNQAGHGHAFAMQSAAVSRKSVFRGITLTETKSVSLSAETIGDYDSLYTLFKHHVYGYISTSTLSNRMQHLLNQAEIELMDKTISELSSQFKPLFQIQIDTNMVLLESVQITLDGNFYCGAASQGILAIDSEIILQPDKFVNISFCVAARGGAIALYGESYIRFSTNSAVVLSNNHAFQRGGALYVDSTQHAVPRIQCFLKLERGQRARVGYSAGVIFLNNSANHDGQSAYISELQSCFINLRDVQHVQPSYTNTFAIVLVNEQVWIQLGTVDGITNSTSAENGTTIQFPIVSLPVHVDGTAANLDNPPTIQLIPGKLKQLPYKHAYDLFGNVINTVFTVQFNTQETTTDVQLNPFSKYTSDFTVIIHGIPQKYGIVKHHSTTNRMNTTRTATPQLVLQSLDNTKLFLVMNIELQCCPPGYIYRIGSGDMGTCHCGMPTVQGIEDCNETDPNNIGAVLQGEHWAGYLRSNDQLSCDGQKFFSAPCPPGYCQTHQTILPNKSSEQLLEEVVCGGSKRKGQLCGDCLEGYSIAVNFNGMRPVCTSCQDGLSTVGLLVWILSEWVPMLVVMFVVMLFNVDLVSGRFNSFLLFAQLLAFSSIRGDAELGPVHIAFVKIYRFLYGMWNLDFFGVLLPPYCLIPHSRLTLLQTLLLHYSIGLFPLIVAITLIVLERSAEKWICCHRVDQCLRRMRRWKAKYSDGMSYDRALPAFVILGFTRFLVSSSYILVNQTITGEDGEERMVVWWQGSVPYGSIQHIAYFIPAIIILLVFVLLPAFLLLTLPIVPQLFCRLIIAVPPLRKLQRMQTFCSNVYTDRWIYHFVNVFQGCYKEHYRSFSSLYLFYRIIHLLAAVFIPRVEVALCIQLILTLLLLQLIVIFQPYTVSHLNILDTAVLGNMSLILVLSLLMNISVTPLQAKQFFASVRMIFIFLPLLYPAILCGRKVYVKCAKLRCCQKKEENEDDVEPLIVDPTEGLGNFIQITELRAGAPTSSDEESEIETQSEETLLENQNTESVVVDLAI